MPVPTQRSVRRSAVLASLLLFAGAAAGCGGVESGPVEQDNAEELQTNFDENARMYGELGEAP